MRMIQSTAVLATLLFLGVASTPSRAADEEGVALAIVYDTSGSMGDKVRDTNGNPAPKYVIANRALEAIAKQVQGFVTNAPADSPRKVHAGLFVFADKGAKQAIPFGLFKEESFRSWAQSFKSVTGGTPLGTAVNAAGDTVLNSGLRRKHVLVISDGESNVGPDPATAMAQLKGKADQKETTLSVHFVAFDVDAKIFDGVKKRGATVLSAANELQLNSQLEFILEKKILLEEEESPKKK
jgi:hypothetical protein